MNAAGDHSLAGTDPGSQRATLWGVLMICLGVAAMLAPLAAGMAVAVTVGLILVIAGSLQFAFAFHADKLGRGLLRVFFGGVTLAAGIYAITQSGLAAAALGLLLAAYFIADGFVALAAAFARTRAHRIWLGTYGLLSILLGLLLWLGWPLSGVFAIGILLGIRLVFAGVMMVLLGRAPVGLRNS